MAAPGLEFQLSANLGQFLQQMQQGDRAVNQAMQGMARSSQALEGRLAEVGKSAKASAAVFQEFEQAGNEFRQLQGQLDPAVRALHEYQRAQMLVSAAVEAGAVSQDRANAVLAQARVRYEAATAGLEQASARGARSVGGFGGAMQQAGFQVGDLAVQLQAGTSPLVAFTQQGSQLVSMFGPWGAAIGAAGAVMGALVTTLWDSEDAAGAAADSMPNLADQISDAADAYRELTGAAEETNATLLKTVRLGMDAAKSAATASRETLRDAAEKASARGVTRADLERLDPNLLQQIETFVPGVEFSERRNPYVRPGMATGAPDIEELRETFNAYTEAAVLARQAEDRFGEFIASIGIPGEEEPATGAARGGGGGGGRGGFTRERADELQEIAQKLQDMTVAARNAAYEFGLSGEELAEFKAETEAYNLVAEAMAKATPEQAAKLRELAEGYIEASVAVERKRQAQEDATEAAKAAKQAEQDLQTELSSMVSGFSSATQSADSFVDALKRVGVQIAELALKGALLGEGPFAAGGAGGSILDSLLTSAVGGYWSGGTNLAADPTPGVTGRASGGPVRAGVPYAINEHLHGGKKTELFVPSVNGAVMNVAQAQQAARGGAAGPVNASFSTTITGTGLSARELAAVLERRDKQMVSTLSEAMKRGGR